MCNDFHVSSQIQTFRCVVPTAYLKDQNSPKDNFPNENTIITHKLFYN